MMQSSPSNQIRLSKQELGIVLFAVALTIFMIGLMVFSYTYHYDGNDDQPVPNMPLTPYGTMQ